MFDRQALHAALLDGAELDFETLAESHPSLFSAAAVSIPLPTQRAMADLVAAIEAVVAMPAYQQRVLAWAPAAAGIEVAARSVFFGYDFHLAPDGPKLIEINTNAGGALLNTRLLMAHGEPVLAQAIEADFVAMFRAEWQLTRGDAPLRRIAIVDENPAAQYLAPEFELFRRLFLRHGIDALIADPGELRRQGEQLFCRGEPVDLVYNRLTDFSLDGENCVDLRTVFAAGGVVVTPHPPAHALYADKRNLMLLSDPVFLDELGAPEAVRSCLLAGVPRTVAVQPEMAEAFWRERKQWFFKPAAGYGSRATYRGDKLTKRVFEEILQGGYIAQQIIPPSEWPVSVDGNAQAMKLDVRCYVYAARLQLVAARLYQGQTTNFRTPGGGFAPVFAA